MTTLAAVLQKNYEYTADWNSRGFVTYAFLGIAVLGVAVYLAATAWWFFLSFAAEGLADDKVRVSEQSVALEVEVRAKRAGLAEIHPDAVSGMEKISAMKYLVPENVASSGSSPQP